MKKHAQYLASPIFLGDWWTPLVLRELMYGRSRFDQIQRRPGIIRAILTRRLRRLEDEALVE